MLQVKAASAIADTFIRRYCNRRSARSPRLSLKMRLVVLMLLCAFGAATAASLSASATVHRPRTVARATDSEAIDLVRMAADSLVARHRAMPTGGWAWRSSVQAPHYQTDRDVGAAGIGEGLLAAHAVTGDPRYRRAAVEAGDYLLGVAEPAAGGLRWPDWADPDGRRSDTHFTSFDDGAAGISDYLWKLYEVTHERRFRAGAIAGMRWLVARAEGRSCPQTACSWTWTDDPGRRVAYYGVGMGQAGIVLALDSFADRTGDASFRAHARAGAASLRNSTENGTRPLPRGSEEPTTFETGFLSGSAGAAYMFLERYRRDRDPVDLATARALLAWVDNHGWWIGRTCQLAVRGPLGRLDGCGLRARRRRDRLGPPSGRSDDRRRRLPRACASGRTLAAAREPWRTLGGAAWRSHVSAARRARQRRGGIGWVLEDLARAGLDSAENRTAARSALAGLRAEARRDRLGTFWYESRTGTVVGSRRAVLALGLRRDRRLRGPAQRLVGASSRWAARSLTPRPGPDNIGHPVSEDTGKPPIQFEPLRPASRATPDRGSRARPAPLARRARDRGLRSSSTPGRSRSASLVTVASFVVSLVVLTLLRERRVRQEERYVDRR